MAERSSKPEPFNCKTPPNEIDEPLPMLEPFSSPPQNVEEDLEYIMNITLIQPRFGEEFAHNIIKPSSKYTQKSTKLKHWKSP